MCLFHENHFVDCSDGLSVYAFLRMVALDT